MTQTELAKIVSIESVEKTSMLISQIFNEIEKAMQRGEEVKIKGFATFRLRRNRATDRILFGKKTHIPAKNKPYVKFSQGLLGRIADK